jgi:hypothetical protein
LIINQSAAYRTAWLNSAQLPGNVSHLKSRNSDNSAFVLDRFWQIKAWNYTTKPGLSDLTFTYLDEEHSVPDNAISEEGLRPQCWDDGLGDWEGISSAGVLNPATNTLRIPSVAASELDNWWILADQSQPLPVSLLFFNAKAVGREVTLSWKRRLK